MLFRDLTENRHRHGALRSVEELIEASANTSTTTTTIPSLLSGPLGRRHLGKG